MNVLLTADQIRDRVHALAAEVRDAYVGKPFTVVGVLTGSLVFLADLIRQIDLPLQIGLIAASSYRGTATSPGELTIKDDLLPDIRGRHLLLLDDILDTGQTVTRLVEHLRDRGAASVRVCVFLRKTGRQRIPFEPDFCGFTIPDAFVVGYGLDYNDEYRHLPYIGILAE
ncbi:hypoxanthine phosphoribosyltransferase [Fimbriiglobus ruber]|uniref:Hypoxanthine phosphoribosyltransferase n=1 Tax=Fimbriiglobus ruber TaxID=1908690 RepID=A0A225EEB0_9BACT|nr:hypoxanthine phosphoribosyltransferase [Fimbriiglobus ruber]OWK46637.1 Hypoxanthine-guanine phosphoribosyltransferase [Fimbriiglobus ruber]